MQRSKLFMGILGPFAAIAALVGTAAAGTFDDVPSGAFYEDAVEWMALERVTTGTTPTTFDPLNDITRGEFATFLWRLAFEPEPASTSTPFVDVPTDRFYSVPVAWLVEAEITTGKLPTIFDPDATVTRGEAATFLWRFACRPVPSGSEPFVDVSPGAFYYDPVRWMVDNDITTGKSPTIFDPDAPVTRGEAGTFVWRFVGEPVLGDPGVGRNTLAPTCTPDPPDPELEGSSAVVQINAGEDELATTIDAGAIRVINTSTSASITEVEIDLSTSVIPDMVFDPEVTASLNSTTDGGPTIEFDPGTTTAVVGGPESGGFRTLTITSSGFDPGEELVLSIDTEPLTINGGVIGDVASSRVSGLELYGATVTVTWSNGFIADAVLVPFGSQGGGGQAVVRAGIEAPPPVTKPTITIDGGVLVDGSSTTVATGHTVVVAGDVGDEVLLMVAEGELDAPLGATPPAGYGLPFDVNSFLKIRFRVGTIGPSGTVTFSEVGFSAGTGMATQDGLNHVVAVAGDVAAGESTMSETAVIELVD